MSKGKNDLFKNITSLGIVQIANYVFPLISIPIISRIIGPEKFGVISYASAFCAYFNLIVGFGFDLTGTRQLAMNPHDKSMRNRLFSEIFLAKNLLLIISIIFFIVCLFTIQPLKNELLVSIYTFILCFSVVFTQNWFFQAMQDLPKVAILNFIGKLLFTGFVLYFVKKPNDYVWQPLIASIVQIFVAILSFLWAMKKYELKLEKVPIVDIIKVLWKEKMVFFSLVVISMYTTTNTVILGLIENPKQVGFYTAGQRLIDIAKNVINIPIAQALYPFIGSAFAISKEKGMQTVSKVIPLIMIFTVVVAFLMWLGGSIFIINFYGKDFEPSIEVFQILVFIPVIVSLNNVFGVQVMLNLKMDNLFFKITLSGAILGVCSNVLMVTNWGYIGTAINWVIVEIYITLAMYISLRIKGIQLINFNEFQLRSILLQLKPIFKKLN